MDQHPPPYTLLSFLSDCLIALIITAAGTLLFVGPRLAEIVWEWWHITVIH